MNRLAVRRVIACALLLAPVAVSGCDDDPTATSALMRSYSAAKDKWEASALESYSFVVFRSCECLPDGAGPVHVTVTMGAVTNVQRVDTGAQVAANLWFDIDALFALIASELARLPERVHATYDSTFGFPTHLTYGETEVDGGAVIIISHFAF